MLSSERVRSSSGSVSGCRSRSLAAEQSIGCTAHI
jgi:hypothetical protein